MIADVHHHWMPSEHAKNVEKYLMKDEITQEGAFRSGQRVKYIIRDSMKIFGTNEKYHRLDEQVKDMDEAGIDIAVLHLGMWQNWNNMQICRFINDAMAEAISGFPDRFVGLAHVPIGVAGATEELDRAVKDLGFRGIGITTHSACRYPDEYEYRDLYRKISELEIPVVVHASPLPAEYNMFRKYDIAGSLGRQVDQVLATVRILYSGILADFPKLRFIMGHIGGGFPMVKEILGSPVFTVPKQPIEQSLRQMFFDTCPPSRTPAQIRLAVESLGRSYIMLGSDYPIRYDAMKLALARVRDADIGENDRVDILWKNAAELFKLKQ